MKETKWSKEELEYIKNNIYNKSIEELSLELNRTKRAVRSKVAFLKISLRDVHNIEYIEWSNEEDEFLRKNYHIYTVKQLSKFINRTEYAIRSRKNKLNLNNKYETIKEFGGRIYIRKQDGYDLYFDKKMNKLYAHHRIIYENHNKLNLEKHNIIHHIDGNKSNNDINNLLLCENASKHKLVHSQLEKVAYKLIQEGYIIFDQETKMYIANSNRRLFKE
jgi:hypothetical protein